LRVGQSATLRAFYTVDQSAADGSTITDTATIANVNEAPGATGSANFTTTIHRECNLTALHVTNTSSNVLQVVAGSGVQVVHTFTLINNGPSECDGVNIVFDDNFNNVTGVTAVNGTGNVTVTTNIRSEQQQTFTVVYNVASNAPPAPVGVITTLAGITSVSRKRTTLTGPTVSISTPIVRVVGLSITKTADNDLVHTGSSVTYTVTVTNNGPSDTNGLVVSENCATATGVIESGCIFNATLNSPFPSNLTAGASVTRTLTVNTTTPGFGVISNVAVATGINGPFETTTNATSLTLQTAVGPLEPSLTFSAFRSRNSFDESDEDDDESERCTEHEHSAERCTRLFFLELANNDANIRADTAVVAVHITNVAIAEALLTQSSRDDTVVNNGHGSFTWTVATLQPGARSRIALKVRASGSTQQITAQVEMAQGCLPRSTPAVCQNFPVATVSPYSFSKTF